MKMLIVSKDKAHITRYLYMLQIHGNDNNMLLIREIKNEVRLI